MLTSAMYCIAVYGTAMCHIVDDDSLKAVGARLMTVSIVAIIAWHVLVLGPALSLQWFAPDMHTPSVLIQLTTCMLKWCNTLFACDAA